MEAQAWRSDGDGKHAAATSTVAEWQRQACGGGKRSGIAATAGGSGMAAVAMRDDGRHGGAPKSSLKQEVTIFKVSAE